MDFDVYVGPYFIFPKDFDWFEWEDFVADGRREAGNYDEFLYLIPNRELQGIDRDLSFSKHGGDTGVASITSEVIAKEMAAFKQLIAPLAKHCEENGIEIQASWGILICLS